MLLQPVVHSCRGLAIAANQWHMPDIRGGGVCCSSATGTHHLYLTGRYAGTKYCTNFEDGLSHADGTLKVTSQYIRPVGSVEKSPAKRPG
jgi:hypothetical protein